MNRHLLPALALFTLATTAWPSISSQVSQPVPILRVQGARFVDEAGKPYVPRWVSGLTLLSRTPAEQSVFLDWAKRTGFNGVRVFAGALTWLPQTPQTARKALPALLDRAAARGLVVEVTALTDTASGYDAKAHLLGVGETLSGRRGVVLELANEVGHPAQSNELTPERLRAWGGEVAEPRDIAWAIGAGVTDGGRYITAHLDRGGEKWDQIARVRDLYAMAGAHGRPVLNNEPMGADERDGSKTGLQRWSDPAAFFALGALDRASGFGGVHHSQAGLMARKPGPVQQRSADAYVAGHKVVESILGEDWAAFRKVGQPGGPVQQALSLDADRVLSFTTGDRAVVVVVGATAATRLLWASGWKAVDVVKSMASADGHRVDVIHASAATARQVSGTRDEQH